MKPFWLISNQNAKFSPDNSSLFGGLYIGTEVKRQNVFYEEPEDTTAGFTLDYGLEAFNRYNGNYDIQLNQYYAEASWWHLNLQAGAKAESFGNQYDPLSSGSLLYSNNGRPIPKIAISSDYMDVPFTKGYIEFKGYLSHGWFEEDRYTSSPYLHHKNVYVRVGGDLPIHAHYGFHHYAIWGGYSPEYGGIPDGWNAYKKIFFVKKGDEENVPQGEVINALGEHLGSRNFGLEYEGNEYRLKAYWQTIIEDNSGKVWRNIEDGLWGILYKNQKSKNSILKTALFEYIHTKDQSGDHERKDGHILGGNDNYFNHKVIYHDGWTSRGYIMGTPLITSSIIQQGQYATPNNKLVGFHMGFMGWFTTKIQYRTLFTYSRNYGTNDRPFDRVRKNLSLVIDFQYSSQEYSSWMLNAQIAADFGNMYGSNFGFKLSLLRRGNF